MFYIISLKKIIKKILAIFIFIIFIYLIFNIFNSLFPLKYYSIIKKCSVKYNIKPEIIASIINVESRFRKNLISYKGASGLMQIRKCTADWGAKEICIENYSYNKIFEPNINIEIGTWYIRNLLNNYNGDLNLALAAYNAGSGTVSSWLKNYNYCLDGKNLYYIPYKETRNYLKKVRLNIKIYKIILWGKLCIKKLL